MQAQSQLWENDTIPDNDQYQQNQQQFQKDEYSIPFDYRPSIVNNKVNINVPNNLYNGDFNFQDNLSNFKNSSSRVYREFLQQDAQKDMDKIKKQKKHCNACETRFIKYESKVKYNQFQGIDINRSLLDARILLNKNQYYEAESILESIVQKKIDHSDVYYMLGETKRLLGKLKESEYYLLQSIQFEAHSPYVFNSLALVYMKVGSTKRAILLLKKFVEQITDAKAYFNLGRCYIKDDNALEAAVHFTKAIELNSVEPFYYLHRADAYETLGYIELATSDYKKFKELKPDYIQKLQQQATELSKEQNKEDTINIINYIKKLSLY